MLTNFSLRPKKPIRISFLLLTGKITPYQYSLQNRGPKLMQTIYSMCDKVGLKPFLAYGTLLGYIRERAVIEHDHDMDLGIYDPEEEKLKELIEAMKDIAETHVLKIDTLPELRGKIAHITFSDPKPYSCWIDIYIFYPYKDEVILHVDYYEVGKTNAQLFKKKHFGNLEKKRFLNMECFVPAFAEEMLRDTYGDWETPRASLSEEDYLNKVITELKK